MARQIEREELVEIANGISQDVEELNTYLNELKDLEAGFSENWSDTDPNSKATDCLNDIATTGQIVEDTIRLSEGVSEIYIEDSLTGGDI